MHTETSFDAFLAKQLRAESEYLDDAGFSARVMAQLPVQQAPNPLLTQLIFWLPLLAISLWVASLFPWRDLLRPVYAFFLVQDPLQLVIFIGLLFFVGCLLWVLPNTNRISSN